MVIPPSRLFVLRTATSKGTSTHQSFSQENVLKVFSLIKLDRMWTKLTFTGLGVKDQKYLVTLKQILEAAEASTPGAIGYISNSIAEEYQVNVIHVIANSKG